MATEPHSSHKLWLKSGLLTIREEIGDAQMRRSKKKKKEEAFKNEKHTNLPEERRHFNRKSLVRDVTGCVSSRAGNPLVSDGHLACVRVLSMRMWGRRSETLHNSSPAATSCSVYFPASIHCVLPVSQLVSAPRHATQEEEKLCCG